MRMFNADGSEGKMCGNGVRCVAEFLYTHGVPRDTLEIDTLAGRKTLRRLGEGQWQAEMGCFSAMGGGPARRGCGGGAPCPYDGGGRGPQLGRCGRQHGQPPLCGGMAG